MADVAGNETDQGAAARKSDDAWVQQGKLDPQLLMAAHCHDSKRLKELLRVNINDEDHADGGGIGMVGAAPASEAVVIVDVVPRRPPPPFPAASGAPPPAPPPPPDEGMTMEGDSLLHVVAACGDGDDDCLDCAKMIVRDKKHKGGGGAAAMRLALEARNSNGDTPLHRAAAAGNARMISCLLDLVASTAADDEAAAMKALVRTQNKRGETALHQAVRAPAAANKVACVDRLMDVDPELACIPFPHQQEDAASPLYLAISLGELGIARHLHSKSKGNVSYSGPDGRNVLHAAVHRGQAAALPMVLEWLKKDPKAMEDDDMPQQQEEGQGHADLLSHLTSQRDKENGSTPLHLAASWGGLPSANWFHRTHPYFWGWSGSPARMLLDANESMAYQPDKRGLYPIHVAAGAGSLRVVKALLGKCPECAVLRDAEGRTFLHVAVEEGRYGVVKYVCRQNPGLASSSILNAQDKNGDTPLHRAVHAGYSGIFYCLVRNPWVRLDVQNNKGRRPIDVSWSTMPLRVYYAWDPRIHIQKYLLRVGAPYGESRGDLFGQKHVLRKEDEDKISENLTAAVQVMCIFSVLITTVTFASAFTLPGGSRSAGDAGGGVPGTPVLAGSSYVFDAFILSDALAFIFSLYATSLLLYAGVPYGTLNARFSNINLAYTLLWHAGRSLLAAFALGLYVVLLPVARTIAIAVAVLMVIIAIGFLKASEGINSMIVIGRIPIPAVWNVVLGWVISVLDHFWSTIIIFGLPAIRKWANLP